MRKLLENKEVLNEEQLDLLPALLQLLRWLEQRLPVHRHRLCAMSSKITGCAHSLSHAAARALTPSSAVGIPRRLFIQRRQTHEFSEALLLIGTPVSATPRAAAHNTGYRSG
jgi:hypothetical protein